MTTTQYRVTGMTCAHCESAVRAGIAAVPGVHSVDVDLASGTVRVTAQAVSVAAISAAVDDAGYQLVG